MRTQAAVVVLLGLLAAQASAQAPAAPPARPQPQPQAQATPAAPAVAPPTRTPPPPPPAARAAGTRATPVGEPVRPVARAAAPVDSVRPKPAAALAMPANAVAQCNDDTFVIAPNDATSACSAHRGVLVRFPSRATSRPPAPSAMPLNSQAAVRAADAPTPATAPPGSTMQCKDGTFLSGQAAAGRCDRNGGVAAILPAPRATPTPPPAPPQGVPPQQSRRP